MQHAESQIAAAQASLKSTAAKVRIASVNFRAPSYVNVVLCDGSESGLGLHPKPVSQDVCQFCAYVTNQRPPNGGITFRFALGGIMEEVPYSLDGDERARVNLTRFLDTANVRWDDLENHETYDTKTFHDAVDLLLKTDPSFVEDFLGTAIARYFKAHRSVNVKELLSLKSKAREKFENLMKERKKKKHRAQN